MQGGQAETLGGGATASAESVGLAGFEPERVPTFLIEPLRGPAAVVAAVSPDSSYRLVKEALAGARERVDLYIYNVSADHLVALLNDCLARGVALRIMYDTHDTRGDEAAKIRSLAGAEVRFAPSSGGRRVFTVCHQKFAVIDGETVLIESANWASSSIPKVDVPGTFKKGNREWLLLIKSQPLAEWYATLFQADWDIPELPRPDAVFVEEVAEPLPVEMPFFIARLPDEVFDLARFDAADPITITPIVSPQNYLQTALALIEGAAQSIDIQQQYIIDGGGSTRRLLEAVAAKAGEVTVRIIVSPAFRKKGGPDNWERSVDSIKAHGLDSSLRALNLRFYTHCHNKGLIVDRRTVVVSSTNWSDNSIERAREAGVVVEAAAVAEYFARVFDFDWGIGWDAADVPANLASVFTEAMFQPEAFDEIHPADLA